MSVGAPRGLASSGQKPIAEIIHPLSAAEEPLSLSVSVGGDKVKHLPVKPVNLNLRPGRVRVGSVLKYRVHKTSEAAEVQWTNQCSVCSQAVTGGSS